MLYSILNQQICFMEISRITTFLYNHLSLINLILSLLMSTWWLRIFAKTHLVKVKQVSKYEESDNREAYRSVNETDQYLKSTLIFVCVSGITLSIGFVLLNQSQSLLAKSQIINNLVSSGLYVLPALILFGCVIKLSFEVLSRIMKLEKITSDDMKIIILVISLFLNSCLFRINSELGLAAAAVILGKYIWIDSIFDFERTKSEIKSYIDTFKNEKISSVYISVMYGINLISYFSMIEIVNIIFSSIGAEMSADAALWINTLAWIVIGGSLNSYIGGMQTANARDTLRKVNSKKRTHDS